MTSDRLHELLEKTSRTFALAIPLLPEPRREQVTIAYLLFRIADTLEDAHRWPRERRIEALHELDALLESPATHDVARLARGWREPAPLDEPSYLELLDETPLVLRALGALDDTARAIVTRHTRRTALAMAGSVALADEEGTLRLPDLAALRDYCYGVAGIVGEMLTDLYLLDPALDDAAPALRERARFFGEALQLVNILKDADDDARRGRVFLPASLGRDEIFALARRDLRAAAEYTNALQQAGAARGVVRFNALPARLAAATLRVVEERGPGAKITRAEVWAIVARLDAALAAGLPAVPEEIAGEGAPWADTWAPSPSIDRIDRPARAGAEKA